MLRLALVLAIAVASAAPAQRAAVAARELPRGAVLATIDIAYVAGEAEAPVAPGWITRRVVRAGEPLRAPAVAPPPAVRAGEAVTLLVRRGAVQLSLAGTAARDAAPGEPVTVRVDARRRFDGIAEGRGVVRLP